MEQHGEEHRLQSHTGQLPLQIRRWAGQKVTSHIPLTLSTHACIWVFFFFKLGLLGFATTYNWVTRAFIKIKKVYIPSYKKTLYTTKQLIKTENLLWPFILFDCIVGPSSLEGGGRRSWKILLTDMLESLNPLRKEKGSKVEICPSTRSSTVFCQRDSVH